MRGERVREVRGKRYIVHEQWPCYAIILSSVIQVHCMCMLYYSDCGFAHCNGCMVNGISAIYSMLLLSSVIYVAKH